MNLISQIAPPGQSLTPAAIENAIAAACAGHDWQNKRVLLIVPDSTRTAPIGPVFKTLHRLISPQCRAVDVMVALGTHPPMTQDAICERLELSPAERAGEFAAPRLLNHEWDNPDALRSLGHIPAADISELSDGLFAMDVPVSINKHLFDYDRLIIIGPVFPHEVVGFSGGALWSTVIVANRGDTLATAVELSGGSDIEAPGFDDLFAEYVTPTSDLPVLLTSGSPEADVWPSASFVVVNFAEATDGLQAELAADGHFVVRCQDDGGHEMSRQEWNLAKDWLASAQFGEPSPYEADGLGGDDDWCAVVAAGE